MSNENKDWHQPIIRKGKILQTEYEIEFARYGKPSIVIGFNKKEMELLKNDLIKILS